MTDEEYGKLVEEGNHTELMQKKGIYYTLFTTQASRYVSEHSERMQNEEHPKSSSRPFPPHGIGNERKSAPPPPPQ